MSVSMTTRLLGAVIVAAVALAACGSNNSTNSSTPQARFTADTPSPGDGTVALLPSGANGASVSVRITVTGVNSFFGAAFRVNYDPNALLFTGWDTSSSFLRDGVDADVFFDEDHLTNGGQIVIVATRVDPSVVLPVNVGPTSNLAILNFIARKPIAGGAVEGRLDFGDPKQACDGGVTPPGCNAITVTWSGGGVSAQSQ
jgi:hypothetical protein